MSDPVAMGQALRSMSPNNGGWFDRSPSGATNAGLGVLAMMPGPIGLAGMVGDFGKGIYYGSQNLQGQPTTGFFTDPSMVQRAGNWLGRQFAPSTNSMPIAQNATAYPDAQSSGTSMSSMPQNQGAWQGPQLGQLPSLNFAQAGGGRSDGGVGYGGGGGGMFFNQHMATRIT